MLAIRLTRTGAKKRPSYRIIVSEKRYKRDGAYIERLGHYNPLTEPATVVVDRPRFDYWIEKGAQPSDVVKRIVLGVKGTKQRKPKKAPEEKPAEIPKEVTAKQASDEVAAEETTTQEAEADNQGTEGEQAVEESTSEASDESTEENA